MLRGSRAISYGFSSCRLAKPCLLAATPRMFLERVQWCVEHRDEVRTTAAAARAHVLAKRTVEANIGAWRAALTG